MHTRFHLEGVGEERVQETGDGRRSNVLGEEEVEGKLHRVRRDGGTIISQTAHGNTTWHMSPPYEGGQRERGENKHLYGVLPQGNTVGKVPGTRLP